MIDLQRNIEARSAMLRSIRDHLAASAPYDAIHAEKVEETAQDPALLPASGSGEAASASKQVRSRSDTDSLVGIFRENLEAVGGHCIVAPSEPEVRQALTRIVADLQKTLRARRIALSNAPVVGRLARQIEVNVGEIAVLPSVTDLFNFDVGVTTAQAAIAETGTLVLKSECEKHRLVSLVPPVHIAIIDAASVYETLGETLSVLHQGVEEISPTITFITGPSRTADIELTLAIGVHGPQQLYVIVNEGPPLVS